jgi:exodeoxyribonuclease VII small subunit
MSTKKSTNVSYQELSDQLDTVLIELQAEDLDVDRALELYKQGRELVDQLQKRLEAAEHTVTKLQSSKS